MSAKVKLESEVPTTIGEFARACEGKDDEFIFDLFEFRIGEDLRNAIYNMAPVDSPEPFRAACIMLGELYNVQALIDY